MVAAVTPSCSSKKSKVNNIQVVEVSKDNFNAIWPYLLVSVKAADYIALDLELSGLGCKRAYNSKNMEERYEVVREAAMTRGILSFGLSTFKLEKKNDEKRRLSYRTQVFNVLTVSSQPFTIEPEALEFLAKHSFDFNRLISTGVRYHTSNVSKSCPIRSLFTEILSSGVPLCLHNGFLDMAFVYHHFYSPLPASYGAFCNALSDLFPTTSPLCDSKYLAEYETRMTGSFLEYVFRKCQGDNVRDAENSRWHLQILFDDFNNLTAPVRDAAEFVSCSLPEGFPRHVIPFDIKDKLCSQFSNHGFCRKRSNGICDKLHDVDFALDLEHERLEKERRKRKRRFDHLKPDSVLEQERREQVEMVQLKEEQRIGVDQLVNKPRIAVNGCHRAGVDAFMTGYAVLYQCRMRLCREGTLDEKYVNRLPLSGKQQPLLVQRTNFSGACAKHEERFACLAGARQRIVEARGGGGVADRLSSL